MTIDKTTICNMALSKLHAGAIESIDDQTSGRAINCNKYFDIAVREVLRQGSWSSATTRTKLARKVDTPLSTDVTSASSQGYAYSHTLPDDFIRLIDINSEVGSNKSLKRFTREGKNILSNSEDLILIYVYYDGDVSSWDMLLCDLVAIRLARYLTGVTTGDDSKIMMLDREFQVKLIEALTVLGNELGDDYNNRMSNEISNSPILNSGFTGYTSNQE